MMMENPRASNSERQAARSGSREMESCLENGIEGQTGKVMAEPLLQKVRQRLRMQKNKTKTLSRFTKGTGESLVQGTGQKPYFYK